MRDLAALSSLHAEINLRFEDLLGRALDGSSLDEARRITTKQRLNDQAYFVLCWGQLEAEIDDRCREVIRAGRAHADWRARRGWQMYNPDDRRLSGLRFEDRVGLVLDRDGGPGSPYARVMDYYALRNGIAHGRLRTDGVEIGTVVADFHLIQSELA